MKITKIEDEKKSKLQTKIHRFPVELMNAVDALNKWLDDNPDFRGDLEWNQSFEAEIRKEITRRNAKPANEMGEIKLKLSKETLDEIRECDRDYAAKGYSIDWSAVHITILKKLIKQNTQGLAKVFETEPPEALAIFHKEQSDTEVKPAAETYLEPEHQEELEMEEEIETV